MDTNKKMKVLGRGFNIEDGPGRDLLFDAAKYAHDRGTVIPVAFSVATGCTEDHAAYIKLPMTDVRIEGVAHEDGSGWSFNLTGHAKVAFGSEAALDYKFSAYYNAKTRRGYIHFGC